MTNPPAVSKDLIISVVVPVYNERDEIRALIEETLGVLGEHFRNFELLVIDDASTDGSFEQVREALTETQNVRQISLSRHYGREVALTAGLDHAIGDYVVVMSADFQDPPELIPEMVARAQEGFDVVYVSKPQAKKQPILHRIAASVFYRVSASMTGFSLPKDATDFRVLSRRAVNSIAQLKEHNRYMRMLYAYVGLRVSDIPFRSSGRQVPEKVSSYKEKFTLALDAIVSFSDKPLRYVAVLSMFTSVLTFLGSVWVFLEKLFSDQVVEGWASLMLIQLLMFSLLFLFLAMLSEYVSRILTESKNRPLYYIREENGGTKFEIGNILDAD